MNRMFLLFALFFSVLSAGAQNTVADSAKVKKPVIFPGKYYSPCDILPHPTLILSHPHFGFAQCSASRGGEITIDYTCFNHTITGTNKNGKVKWKKDTQKLSSPLILEISEYPFHNKKYDVLLKLQDGSYVMLKSKTGKMKKFEHPGKF